MEKVYESDYFKILVDDTNRLVVFSYTEASNNMNEEEYITDLKKYIDVVKQHKPLRAFGDMRKFAYTIVPDTQKWINNNLFKVYHEIGFEKAALILGSDIFSEISVEQTIEEDESGKFETRYFDSDSLAKQWLLSEKVTS